MSALKIVFMGTPDFAVATLAALVKHNYEVVGVITAPDRPAGRGQTLRSSAVKQYALDNGLTILQPPNLKNPNFLKELEQLQADLQIVVAFRMLPKVVWAMPKYGTFNLHASLLPDYRGAAPINWAIINGEERSGVTTFFIDEAIDTGAIILQEECEISETDNAGSLHDKLMEIGAKLVIKTVKQIENEKVILIPQKESTTKKDAPKLHKSDCELDWELPGKEIYNKIRGLSPYPTAWTTLVNGSEHLYIKIYKAKFEESDHSYPTARVVADKKSLRIAVKNGYIELEEIQLPGKRKMEVKDVLNGLNLDSKAHVR